MLIFNSWCGQNLDKQDVAAFLSSSDTRLNVGNGNHSEHVEQVYPRY